jgi:hypothetical protein
MATITKAGNPVLFTSTGTADTIAEMSSGGANNSYGLLMIWVISGSFQFNIGSAPTSDNPTYTATERADNIKIVLTIDSSIGDGKLHFKAGAGSQTFEVSA